MNDQRLDVRKTCKLCIGGSFVRNESRRVTPALTASGRTLDSFSRASRKDLGDAVSAVRSAFDGWAKRTAYPRGQILYFNRSPTTIPDSCQTHPPTRNLPASSNTPCATAAPPAPTSSNIAPRRARTALPACV